jgi:hypothetical protein
MVRIEQLAQAAIDGDALLLRSLAQDFLQENVTLLTSKAPSSDNALILAVSAGLIELLAQRRGQSAPAWANKVPAVDRAIYLVKSALTMPRLKRLCDAESPLPLRRRNIFAPPTYLEFA